MEREADDVVPALARGSDVLCAIPLGGLEEIGKNMMVFAYGEDLVVVDAGLMFPDDSMPGVDLVVQDITFLERHRDRVRGYLITHGHEDHIGALPYVLARVPAPVYATRLTRGLIEVKLREKKLLDRAELVTIAPGTRLALGAFEVECFHQCHSVPDAVGFALHTPLGTVVHTGDFKFDQTPVDGRPPDYTTLARLGSHGVLALFADSTRADVPGFTASESVIRPALSRVFAHAQGRVIVATFASLISRIQMVVDAAVAHDRQVAVVGRSMVNNVNMAVQLGYLRVPEGALVRMDELPRIPHHRLAIVTTGSQGEPTSALVRMAGGVHKHIQIVPGDTVVVSATPIPGNEEAVGRTVDGLFKLGAHVVYERHAQVHVSGHGAAEELKLMLGLLRPRYLVPIHGQYRHLVAHRGLALEMGMSEGQVVLIENGSVLAFDGESARPVGRVPAGPVFVDRINVGELSDAVVRDRRILAREGILLVVITVDRSTGALLDEPRIAAQGFVDPRNADALIEMARLVVYDALCAAGSLTVDGPDRVTAIRDALATFLYQQTKRRPLVLPVVTEV